MERLPIDQFLPEIVEGVRQAKALVLVAPPGAGKTTRVPPGILRAGILSSAHPNVVMLQPRRVAARAAAGRIAQENNWRRGGGVGYHVRFDKRVGAGTRLRVLTEGILTRQLLADPFLEGVGAVILDEFHERSLDTDLAIAMLREVRQTVRPDLVVIVMSATLEAGPVAKFLGDCPVVKAEGRMYPVEVRYEPPVVVGTKKVYLDERVAGIVGEVVRNARGNTGEAPVPRGEMGQDTGGTSVPREEGDVLVFLPGVEEIRRTGRLLEGMAEREGCVVVPLHGSLTGEEQTVALEPSERRKIILATNIAETSLTIEGVRTVIDSGLARVPSYDPERGMDRLELKRISKASATQRMGRAGRTGPGRCIRMWSEREDKHLAEFELPEVKRVDLCATVLAMHEWGQSDPRKFGWYEMPSETTLGAAEELLEMLGAIKGSEKGMVITPMGRRMLTLPVHPRLGRLLIGAAERGLLREGAGIAAMLAEKDFVRYEQREGGSRQAKTQGVSDVLYRLDLLEGAERGENVDRNGVRQVMRAREELMRLGRRLVHTNTGGAPVPQEELLKLPLWAYPDRVCRRRGSEANSAVMVGGGGVRLGAESVVCQAEFFVALDARHDERSKTREAMVRVASAIEPQWLEEMFPEMIRRESGAVYDAERKRVVGRKRVWYRDLLLKEDRDTPVDAQEAGKVLGEAVRPMARELFAADEEAGKLMERVGFLRKWMPEGGWPEFGEEELGELLAEACIGKRSLEEVKRVSLGQLLKGCLQYPLDRKLDQEAPETIEVPTGNRIRVEYGNGAAPVLAVRLQEIFGWTDTPRLAGGRAAVLLHLLGPNYRPVQITDDLKSFWSGTYFQVRKDLRTRYPKHSWPEDPLTATPQAKGRRR